MDKYMLKACEFTLYDRISKLLESDEWSDCSFRVGAEVMRAHKLILATSSPVFKVMLYGPMADSHEILISDIEPQVFQLLLDFIYKDRVSIGCLENACGLIYAAKKYMLPYLVALCIRYIETSLSIHNVLTIFNFAVLIQEEALITICVKLICKHPIMILNNESEHISGFCLREILMQDYINMSEIDLIKYAVYWAHNECIEQDLIPSKENVRQVLLKFGCFQELRFVTLSPVDLDCLRLLGVLTNAEMLHLNYVHSVRYTDEQIPIMEADVKDKYSINYTKIKRDSIKLEWLFSNRPSVRVTAPLVVTISSQSAKVRIKSKKTVFVNSFSIPTRQSPPEFKKSTFSHYTENMNLILYSNDANKSQKLSIKYNRELPYDSTTFLDLPEPFVFNKDVWYTLSFTWPEVFSDSYRYVLSYRPVFSSDNIFCFEDNYEDPWGCHGSFVGGLRYSV